MDIFCNNNIIMLRDTRPVPGRNNEQQVQFSGKKALQELVFDFENNGNGILIIWSDDDYNKLVKSFLSLHETVEAAGGVVFNEHGEILFIHRNGKWDLPKGKISGKDRRKTEKVKTMIPGISEPSGLNGEAACIAAVREVKEETGLKNLVISSLLPSTYHVYFDGKHRILKHTQWFRMEGTSENTLKPQISEGIVIARWIPAKSLECVFLHTYESLKPLIKSVLANT